MLLLLDKGLASDFFVKFLCKIVELMLQVRHVLLVVLFECAQCMFHVLEILFALLVFIFSANLGEHLFLIVSDDVNLLAHCVKQLRELLIKHGCRLLINHWLHWLLAWVRIRCLRHQFRLEGGGVGLSLKSHHLILKAVDLRLEILRLVGFFNI